jgi:uncharacterized protein
MTLLRWQETGIALAIGLAGSGAAFALRWPSPWLVGSLLATTVAGLQGLSCAIPSPLRSVAFLLLAASMGAAVTPQTLAAMRHWPLSLIILALTVPVLIGVVQRYLTVWAGWERREAVLAAVPGALSYVVAAAVDAGLDARRVALAQTLRLLLVVTLLPFVFQPGPIPLLPVGHVPSSSGLADIAAVLVASGLAALVAALLKVPAPWIIGGLVGSGALHATGQVATAIPQFMIVPALVVTGVAIGSRFVGTRWIDLRAILPHALVAIALAVAVSAAGAGVAAFAIGVPLAQAMLAFAPGGLEASAVLAFSLGYDPTYVASHQLLRFIGIALALPALIGWLRPANPGT